MLLNLILVVSLLIICGLVLYLLIHKNHSTNQILNELTHLLQPNDVENIERFEREIIKLKHKHDIDKLTHIATNSNQLLHELHHSYNIKCTEDDLPLYIAYLNLVNLDVIHQYIKTNNPRDKQELITHTEKTSECETDIYQQHYIVELENNWRRLALTLKLIKSFTYPIDVKQMLKTRFNQIFIQLKKLQNSQSGENSDTNTTSLKSTNYHLGFQTVSLSNNQPQQISNLEIGDKVISFGNKISSIRSINTIPLSHIPNNLKFYCINNDLIISETQLVFTIAGFKSINSHLKIGDRLLRVCRSSIQSSTPDEIYKINYNYEVVPITKIQHAKVNENVVNTLYQIELDNSDYPIVDLYPLSNTSSNILQNDTDHEPHEPQSCLNYISYIDMYETFNKLFDKQTNQKIVDYISCHHT
jgi:hypothetical protein